MAVSRRMALGGLLALVACGRREAAPPSAPSFRRPASLIGSSTRAAPDLIAGDWVVAATYAGALPVGPGSPVRIEPATGGAVWRLGAAPPVRTTLADLGRYEGGGLRLWVLWVDDGFRTAVVGTPDGSFGWIMDRPGAASPDRTEAARRMLDFNGYDLARLAG